MKRIISTCLVVIMMVSMVLTNNIQMADAASKKITIYQFAKALVQELGSTAQSNSKNIKQLKEIGVIKESDFTDYTANLTRGDALVLLSRADDYLNHTEIKDELVQMVIEKRISDIKKVKAEKREDVAKGYIKGFMKGYSNGKYITNREMKVKEEITKSGALKGIQMLKDTSLRAKISPDGQLIRTTNLPKNADKYEYILESFPNKFYERPFEFMATERYKRGEIKAEWVYPVNIKSKPYKNWYGEMPMSEVLDKHLYEWAQIAEDYVKTVFNVDYRTVDYTWCKNVASFYPKSNVDFTELIHTFYLPKMKSNHVIIETSHVVAEPSSLYCNDGDYMMRVYVRYRITARDVSGEHRNILYAPNDVFLDNLVSGQWREGIFDIMMLDGDAFNGDGSIFKVNLATNIVDNYGN